MGTPGNIWDVLQCVCIDDEVKSFPKTTDTYIGNGGVALSGGQQARIALARTLYHKRPVIILDDPFSALDKQTEETILENLKTYAAGCTVIIISHRLSVFPKLDTVLWIENRHISSGSHEDLMKTNENYRNIYLTQTNTVQSDGGENCAIC